MADDSKHIMISYQWDSQKTMLKLRDKLRKKGYNVWMDVDKMGGDILSCMAKAVENAEVLLICVSEKYQMSESCKAEAQYAFKKGKLIVPLMFQSDFEPSDWLGPLMGLKLYYNVHDEEKLEKVFPDLVRELGDKARKAKEEKWTPVKRSAGSKALQCSICISRFKNPKTLPCLHSFCKDCLLRLAPKGTKELSCPLCRKPFPVPDGDATQFPTNFHLKELVEEEATQQQVAGGGAEFSCTCCDMGKQSRVMAKCQDCKLYICGTGLEAHQKFPGLKEHDILIFEMNTEDTDEEEDVQPAKASAPAKTIEKEKPELELKAQTQNWWEIFSALYDDEHSINLFKYWMQQQGTESNWQEAMVNHYLACLVDLEDSGLIGEELLAERQQQVARVFKQAGQYDKALELVEKTLELEKKELGERQENMADLYYLAADIYREIVNSLDLRTHRDPGLLQKQIKYARSSLKLRKTMKGDDNKFELGRVQRILSGALKDWVTCGGDGMLSATDAKKEASRHVNQCVDIFTKLNAKGNIAKAIKTKANLEEKGSEAQEKLHRQALNLCKEAYGDCSVLSGRLHWNMYVLYEDREEYHEAYKWLVKSRDIYQKVYGQHHPQTKQVYDKLQRDIYMDISKEVEAAK
ncbi:uncharacterized protein [Amphiura filiformis]|uniref:uncharacterized protein isoform X1 n=1 Tax=Amphiura filiformis TaxID=82378 RepID=UPI003B22602A